MPVFDTPGPIDIAVNVQVGDIEVIATDRADTVVTVRPTVPDKAADRRAAEATRVAFDGARLTVIGPKPKFALFGPAESVDVTVEVPTGSRLTAEVAMGGTHCAGRLGATRIKNLTGTVELGDTGDLWLRAGHGDTTIRSVAGSADITADHGRVRVAAIAGDARITASHGSVRIDETAAAVEAKLSYGDLDITAARGPVTAKTAYGAITIGAVSAGEIALDSGYGPVTVGIARGVPAWLDLRSTQGRVRNELDGGGAPSTPPEKGAAPEAVAVRVRTRHGDITIRRAG